MSDDHDPHGNLLREIRDLLAEIRDKLPSNPYQLSHPYHLCETDPNSSARTCRHCGKALPV